MKRCKQMTPWGRCSQPKTDTGFCTAHEHWNRIGATPDPTYHEKIVKGLTSPTWDYMSPSEGNAVINGRYRGDGRRLDQWVAGDPMLISLEDL